VSLSYNTIMLADPEPMFPFTEPTVYELSKRSKAALKVQPLRLPHDQYFYVEDFETIVQNWFVKEEGANCSIC